MSGQLAEEKVKPFLVDVLGFDEVKQKKKVTGTLANKKLVKRFVAIEEEVIS